MGADLPFLGGITDLTILAPVGQARGCIVA